MATTAFQYGLFRKSLWNKEVDLDSDALYVMLCTNLYTPNQDTHQYKSSVTNEVSGSGYTAGGQQLTSVVAAYNTTTNTMNLDAADPLWNPSTITSRIAVVYDHTPATDATRPLLCWIDFGADQISTAGSFTIIWDTLGIIADTVS